MSNRKFQILLSNGRRKQKQITFGNQPLSEYTIPLVAWVTQNFATNFGHKLGERQNTVHHVSMNSSTSMEIVRLLRAKFHVILITVFFPSYNWWLIWHSLNNTNDTNDSWLFLYDEKSNAPFVLCFMCVAAENICMSWIYYIAVDNKAFV